MDSNDSPPDVVYISYEEPNAEENYARVLSLAPHAKRVHHIKGVFNAWTQAANIVTTSHFYLVEGDNWILDGFEFKMQEDPVRDIYFWPARNPVNHLEWYNGCLKFLKRDVLFTMEEDAVDFFNSMKGYRQPMEQVATETRFNASPFQAWRTAFRECAKLAGNSVTTNRAREVLAVWQNVGEDALNGIWCMMGARMGADFGKRYKGREQIKAVNDMDWLKSEFERISEHHRQGKLKLV